MRGTPLDALEDSRVDRLTQGVVAVALVGLALRVLFLGGRPSHYDEGRVAWWTMHFLDTGQFEYQFIIHGPFVQIVNRPLFALLGPSDAVARLPVAVVGGVLPAFAWLVRDRLEDTEVVALALHGLGGSSDVDGLMALREDSRKRRSVLSGLEARDDLRAPDAVFGQPGARAD
jgi:hypothetical protein